MMVLDCDDGFGWLGPVEGTSKPTAPYLLEKQIIHRYPLPTSGSQAPPVKWHRQLVQDPSQPVITRVQKLGLITFPPTQNKG